MRAYLTISYLLRCGLYRFGSYRNRPQQRFGALPAQGVSGHELP